MTDPIAPSTDATHDPHVHVFPDGIEEGNARVPLWLIALMLGLGIFLVVYLVSYMTGVQPEAARLRS
jgi:hypothetical protein